MDEINIKIEEIVRLKEEGMTDEAIVQYYTKQGKKISVATVNRKLNLYYNEHGIKKPRVKRKKKTDNLIEDMLKLKEQGMSDEEIAEYFAQKGEKISRRLISLRLTEYYKEENLERMKNEFVAKKRILGITDEELLNLKNKGMTSKEISLFYAQKGKTTSVSYIDKRIRRYRESLGIEVKKRTKKSHSKEITDEELFKLREQGKSNNEIAEYFEEQGKNIANTTIGKRLNQYYKKIGKEIPKVIRGSRESRNTFIPTEELVKYKEKGMTNAVIADICTKTGRTISKTAVRNRLKRYYDLKGEKFPKVKREEISTRNKKTDNFLKKMLMNGITIKEYYASDNNGEIFEIEIRERARRFKVIVEHAKKQGDELVADNDFLEVMKLVANENSIHPQNKYVPYIKTYTSKGKCENGNIDMIRNNVFHNNRDLMTFVLLKFDLIYGEEYDVHIWNKQKQEYEQKIDKYFDRLHTVEENARKQAKGKKKSNKTETKKESNLSNSGEER